VLVAICASPTVLHNTLDLKDAQAAPMEFCQPWKLKGNLKRGQMKRRLCEKMEKARIPFGAWRIDPQKRSQVIDRFGRKVASVESEIDASLIATAPDMFGVLEKLDNDDPSIPQGLREQIQLILRRARGDFGLAVFPGACSRHRLGDEEWLKFMDGLWNSPDPEQSRRNEH
jgi:hypothetical protein